MECDGIVMKKSSESHGDGVYYMSGSIKMIFVNACVKAFAKL